MASTNKDKLKELLGKIAISTNTITVEDDINHYTILELINALRSNVKEINKNLDNLDGEIKEEVKRLIDDGTLGKLINDELLVDINEQLSDIEEKIAFYRTINVKEYGAKGDGITDDTQSILNALNDLDNAVCENANETNGLMFRAAIYGGGELLFPNGVYKISKSISLSPLVTIRGVGNATITVDEKLDGTMDSVFILKDMTTKYNLWDVDGVNFENIKIMCNNKANYGIKLIRAVNSYIKNAKIYSAVKDGVRLITCQWIDVQTSITSGCGRHGFAIVDGTETGNPLPSANISFLRCISQKNGRLEEGHGFYCYSSNVSWTNCTSQYNSHDYTDGSRKNAGLYITGKHSKFCSWTGGHFEQNYIHVITAGGHNTKIDTTYFVIGDNGVPKRFVQNTGGIYTTIINSGSQGNQLDVTEGNNCPYETNLNSIGQPNLLIIGGNASASTKEIICVRNADGTLSVLKESDFYNKGLRCGVLNIGYNGLEMFGHNAANPSDSNFGINYLRLGSSILFENEGKLMIRYGRVPTSNTDGVLVGSQTNEKTIE